MNTQKKICLKNFKFIFLLLLLFKNFAYSSSNEPIIRVLITRQKSIKIEGFDLVVKNQNQEVLLSKKDRSSIKFTCGHGEVFQIQVEGEKSLKRINLKSQELVIESLGGFLRFNNKQFRDSLKIHSFNGDCLLVNHLEIEKYVAGVLDSEMNANWELEALKAQAVAARTYALYQKNINAINNFKRILASKDLEKISALNKNFKPPFDVDSTINDQVYEGAHKEKYNAIKAVNETRGIVLTYNHEPIKAFYHSTCGGYTEVPQRVWGKEYPYIKPVRCGYCEKSPRFLWSFKIIKNEFEKKLKQKSLLKGSFLGLVILKQNGLGRIESIKIKGSLGDIVINSLKLRNILGVDKIFSTNFSIKDEGSWIHFNGRGSGHGVGLCQYGAKAMAEKGLNYKEILSRYYPLAKLEKLY
jgi:stage II sporulation protein D